MFILDTQLSTLTTHDQSVQALLVQALDRLAPQAHAVLARAPLVDPLCPQSSDLDLLVFGEVDGLLPERIWLVPGMPPLDILWAPTALLHEPATFAANGLMPHRLLGSRLVYAADEQVAAQRAEVARQFVLPEIQKQRLAGLQAMGQLTVREIGVSWDFPALAIFWLHIAHAACLATLCDGLGGCCPNVYTRPFDAIDWLERTHGVQLRAATVAALRLDDDPLRLIAPLRRIHSVVVDRFVEPDWPAAMRSSTRQEYRYTSAAAELEWRIGTAVELAARGDPEAAVYYLRFWAYALARLPMVCVCARAGRDVPFMRPECAVLPQLQRYCPEIIGDLDTIFSGPRPPATEDVHHGLQLLAALRDQVFTRLEACAVEVPKLQPWQPYATIA